MRLKPIVYELGFVMPFIIVLSALSGGMISKTVNARLEKYAAAQSIETAAKKAQADVYVAAKKAEAEERVKQERAEKERRAEVRAWNAEHCFVTMKVSSESLLHLFDERKYGPVAEMRPNAMNNLTVITLAWGAEVSGEVLSRENCKD